MVIFHRDPLMREVSETIDFVVEENLYNYWIPLLMQWLNLRSRKIAILHPLVGY